MLPQFSPQNPSKQWHVPVLWLQTPRFEQSTWHLLPVFPTPRPPSATTPVQSVSSVIVRGSSPVGQRRREQSAPKYSAVCVSPAPNPTGQLLSHTHPVSTSASHVIPSTTGRYVMLGSGSRSGKDCGCSASCLMVRHSPRPEQSFGHRIISQERPVNSWKHSHRPFMRLHNPLFEHSRSG